MINPRDSIRYTNVLSYPCEFHYSEIEMAMEQFVQSVLNSGATIKGPLFYSINNVPKKEIVKAELFITVEEEKIAWENMKFHSYFSIENMLGINIMAPFEENTPIAYKLLLDYMEENKLQQTTPFFHIITGDDTLPYLFIKVGYT